MASMVIPLQDSVVYGPISSRRLGNSLGINILPISRKVCSSNCVYCQYGWTIPTHSEEKVKRSDRLLSEIAEAFQSYAKEGTAVDCITVAGNGEPTLHPELYQLTVGIKKLRDHYFPNAAVGILTDSTQITKPSVCRALNLFDALYMKFDAADEATWKRINNPLVKVRFNEILKALRNLPDIILQSMFIQGAYDNTTEAHIRSWISVVGSIKPSSVHLYTIDRGTAAEGVQAVSRAELQLIADSLTTATGISASVFD